MGFFDRLMGNKQGMDAAREAYGSQMGSAGKLDAVTQEAMGRIQGSAEKAAANEAEMAGGVGRQIMDLAPRSRGDAGVNTEAMQANALAQLQADRMKNVRTAEMNQANQLNELQIGGTQAAEELRNNAQAQMSAAKAGRVTPLQAFGSMAGGFGKAFGAFKGGK